MIWIKEQQALERQRMPEVVVDRNPLKGGLLEISAQLKSQKAGKVQPKPGRER
jgi:hypothetical protein